MKVDRKLITQVAAVLLALPLLYVAASGPLLRIRPSQPVRSYLVAFYKPLDDVTADTRANVLWRRYLDWWGGSYPRYVYDLSSVANTTAPAE